MHLLEAFSEDGTPLGAVWSQMGTRDEPADEPAADQPERHRKPIPIEEKESYRWLESQRQARAVAQQVPGTKCVLTADSESDIDEVFAEPRGADNPLEWVIRACQDRAVKSGADDTAGQL